jgi:putative endonuclease
MGLWTVGSLSHCEGAARPKQSGRLELVMYEVFQDSYNAITREKQIKAGSRRRKIELIEQVNPEWRDLYNEL